MPLELKADARVSVVTNETLLHFTFSPTFPTASVADRLLRRHVSRCTSCAILSFPFGVSMTCSQSYQLLGTSKLVRLSVKRLASLIQIKTSFALRL